MLCREFSLVNQTADYAVAIPLECRSWGCEYCQPSRQRQLKDLAASGAPNRFITLTHDPTIDTHRDRRAGKLARAWRIIVGRMRRQYQKPTSKRWQLRPLNEEQKKSFIKRQERMKRNKRIARVCEKDEKTAPHDIAYFCVFEAHKSGEPHLHILFRGRFIPQDWLSEQCDDILKSPICDIRAIDSAAHAAWYVVKYTGKAPHKFGTNKRYWHTQNYTLHYPDDEIENPYAGTKWTICEKHVIDIYEEWAQYRSDIAIEGDFKRISYGAAPTRERIERSRQWEHST